VESLDKTSRRPRRPGESAECGGRIGDGAWRGVAWRPLGETLRGAARRGAAWAAARPGAGHAPCS